MRQTSGSSGSLTSARDASINPFVHVYNVMDIDGKELQCVVDMPGACALGYQHQRGVPDEMFWWSYQPCASGCGAVKYDGV
jgi:hypothetical protein